MATHGMPSLSPAPVHYDILRRCLCNILLHGNSDTCMHSLLVRVGGWFYERIPYLISITRVVFNTNTVLGGLGLEGLQEITIRIPHAVDRVEERLA